ncbi:MAG: hypothetical protein ACOCYB_03705 [Alkalispirochaeta sp.]
MNTRRNTAAVGLVLAIALLAGCTTIDSMVGDALGTAVTGQAENGTRSSEASRQDDDSESPFGAGDGSLTMLPPGAAFQIVHAQTTFFQGFSEDDADFEPGEGVLWRLVWSDGDGARDEALSEHARLTESSDGSWWYVRMETDDYWVEYEYFLQPDGMVVELKYRDSERSEARTADVTVNLRAYDDEEEYGSVYEAMEADDSGQYEVRRSSERISVPAGEFDTERIDVTGVDDETGDQVDITWWRVPSIPGETVQFSFRDDEDGRYDGELMEYRQDYSQQL